jgi:hypothetical protein
LHTPPFIQLVGFRSLVFRDKPFLTKAGDLIKRIQKSDILKNYEIRFGEWGNSPHFKAKRIN